MQNVLTFWTDFLGIIADFLMSEPVVYFVALIILIFVVSSAEVIQQR